MYYRGNGVPKDYKEAAKWFKKSAKHGDTDVQAILGALYYSDEGVPQDYKEAIKWYTKAAEQGHDIAQFSLAGMYHNVKEYLRITKKQLNGTGKLRDKEMLMLKKN